MQDKSFITSEYMLQVLNTFSVEPTYNALKDYLLYYKAWDEKGKPSATFRKTHDLDCVVMDGNLYADTIFSFWMILKMYLQSYFPEEFKPGARSGPNKNAETCQMLLDNYEKFFNPKGAGKDINRFAALAQTRSNYMLLPNRGMQSRGMYYYDQMPITLAQCFDGGKFAKYFVESAVDNWVEEQRLELFFEDGICKEHIKKLGPISCSSAHWCIGTSEVDNMLHAYISILEKRFI